MQVLEKENHLLNAKLIFKMTREFTDEQAEKMFMDTEVESADDISELVSYMRKYRPELYKKLEGRIREIRRA